MCTAWPRGRSHKMPVIKGLGVVRPAFLADFTSDYWPTREVWGSGPPFLADIICEQPHVHRERI